MFAYKDMQDTAADLRCWKHALDFDDIYKNIQKYMYKKQKKNMTEDIKTKISELKREKHCLEFDLTCMGIMNYGPIMRRLDEVNAELKKLKEKYEND